MNEQDSRWTQRANHFQKAFSKLQRAVELAQQRPLSELESQGLIQSFEYTHELAWNTLKDYFKDGGVEGIRGSIDATRIAFKEGLIENGEVWMEMIRSRNLTSHTYNEATATQIVTAILDDYLAEFQMLLNKLEQMKRKQPS